MSDKRKNKFMSVRQILGDNSKRWGIKKETTRYKLWTEWAKIMPTMVAKHTRPIRWQGDVLVVGTPTSAWSQELSYLKPELIEKISTHIPEIKIKDMHFETGYDIPKDDEEKTVTDFKKPLTKEDYDKINEWTGNISDQELKGVVRLTLTSVLSRKNSK